MNTFTAVMLIIVMINSDGKKAVHQEPMPDMDVCLMELGKFVHHQFPDMVKAKHLAAVCEGDIVPEQPS